ncbi:probable lysine-specific demethylase 4A [Frankliniella occidentalis]|uniref:Probable lysine-specific demethylase 4A n=1 Tax=Frankliniella occidentalis TaxID=133901 RepID=A0A9C6WYM2_FRAOC|nr:probable lysine-specific demethylase 4A [Frankliniella occidentalis]
MSFCALNRHVAGAPKVWLCVPPAHYGAFCTMIRNLPIPVEQTSLLCQVLHKEIWIDPRMVISCGIPVYPIVQMPRDIVLLLPNTIHWGYNMGFNVNEAINFVNRSWIPPGMLSHQRCKCTKWFCRFEIRHILRALGVEDNDLRTWESGMKLDFIRRLIEAQPLLYPQLRDLYEEKVDSNYLLADTEEEHDEQHEMSQAVRPQTQMYTVQVFPRQEEQRCCEKNLQSCCTLPW